MHAWLTPRDVAVEAKLTTRAGEPNITLVQRLARRGDLPGIKFGREWRFRRDQFDAWVERRANPDIWQRTPAAEAARKRRTK